MSNHNRSVSTGIPLPERVRPVRTVAAEPAEGEMVLLHFPTGRYFGLNEVGARAWSHLCATGSVAETFERLRSEYDVEDGRLREDLEALVAELIGEGLLERER